MICEATTTENVTDLPIVQVTCEQENQEKHQCIPHVFIDYKFCATDRLQPYLEPCYELR